MHENVPMSWRVYRNMFFIRMVQWIFFWRVHSLGLVYSSKDLIIEFGSWYWWITFYVGWDCDIYKWRKLLTGIFRILNKRHIDVRLLTKMVAGSKFQRQDSHQRFWLLKMTIQLAAGVEEVEVVWNPDGMYVVPSLSGVRRCELNVEPTMDIHESSTVRDSLSCRYEHKKEGTHLCPCRPAKITRLPSLTNNQSAY